MRQIGFWVTLALLVGLLAACGNDRVQPATGALQVDITGLPAGIAAAVVVEGPGGFTQQLTQSRTLSALSVGPYTVSAGTVSGFTAQVSGSPATVSAGATVLVRVAYVAADGPDRPGTGGSISGTVSIVGTAEVAVEVADAAPFVPGEVIVKFKPGLRAQGLDRRLELLRELPLETGLYRTPRVSAQNAAEGGSYLTSGRRAFGP